MSDLPALAEAIAARAESGEQIEAYVARGSSTSVRAYEGEVEDFTSAASAGVGIRVVRDHRQGFAHGGRPGPLGSRFRLFVARIRFGFVGGGVGFRKQQGGFRFSVRLPRRGGAGTRRVGQYQAAVAIPRGLRQAR